MSQAHSFCTWPSSGWCEYEDDPIPLTLEEWQRRRDGVREENLCPCDNHPPEECETCRGACSCHWRKESGITILTRQEAENMADEKAQSILGVPSRHEAFRMLDNGELTGTGAEAEFKRLKHLLS